MSFVSIIANINLCCIMSDGRLTNRATGAIEREDFSKFDSFNNNTSFIASTGTKGFADYLLDNIKIDSNNYGDWISQFHKFYDDPKLSLNLRIHPNSTLQLTFGGLNHNNQIEVYSFDYIGKAIKKHKISSDENMILMLGEEKFFDGALGVYKREMSQRKHVTASDIISTQKLMNNYIADYNPHVNKNTYRLVIKKQ